MRVITELVLLLTSWLLSLNSLKADEGMALAPFWSHPDRMIKHLQVLPSGITVKLRCPAGGHPLPTIKWFKNGAELESHQRNGGFRVQDTKWALVMESVVASDHGNYTCVVDNQHGSINQTYQISLVGDFALLKERAPPIPILEAGLPANQTAMVGSDVEFLCKVYSGTKYHVQWLKHIKVNGSYVGLDGRPHVRVLKSSSTDKDMEVLQLRNVSPDDAGEYTCLVGNSIGISHHSAWLTVHEAPATPWYITVNEVMDGKLCAGQKLMDVLMTRYVTREDLCSINKALIQSLCRRLSLAEEQVQSLQSKLTSTEEQLENVRMKKCQGL